MYKRVLKQLLIIKGYNMEYLNIQTFQTLGGFIFACWFWYMCYKIEKVVNGLKN